MAARTPEECDRLFAQYVNVGNLEALVGLYEPRATFVPQEGVPVTGTTRIREALAGFAAMKPALTMNIKKVVVAGDDLAVLYNDWTMSATGPDGTAISGSGKATEIVRRQSDGTWRFVVDDPFGRG